MRYQALAADYDGTLARNGRIDDATWAALRQLRDSGRKLLMVTGRELDELLSIIPHADLFDRIVAENGALVYEPATKEVRLGCTPPPARFVEELRRQGVERIAVGRAIVATWEPHQQTVLEVIRKLGLELQVIFNKGAVMVLPSGVNKATGLAAALLELGLSPHNAVGIGDAENDHALLEACECGVAVANALPSLKERADLVTNGDHGDGVIELCQRLIDDDLASLPPLVRHHLLVGTSEGSELSIDPYAESIMVCGTSGSGKSTLTTGLLERLNELAYQFVIIDPEGDYDSLDFAVVLGGSARAPLVSEVLDVLRDPTHHAVVNLLGLAVEERPQFFAQLLPALSDLRTRTGRPHWLVIDEAHHLLPATWKPAAEVSLRRRGALYITVHPGSVTPKVISSIGAVLAVGADPDETIAEFCEVTSSEPPPRVVDGDKLAPGQALYWRVGWPRPVVIQTPPPRMERKRHSRKYMEGNLGPDRSFYFRGPEAKLNLKAQNLGMFLDLGAGVDDDTWSYHLQNGHYSPWLRVELKDPELASEIEQIERDPALSAEESRAAVRAAVEKRYTLPSDKPSGVIDAP
jgi:HAD superfamily hydrolase (TIGR01484 family)